MTAAQSLRVIWRMMVIDLSSSLMYRTEFVLYMVSIVVSPAIALMIWTAALDNGATLPIDREYMTTYYVLLAMVSMLTSSWNAGYLGYAIRMGQLSRYLARPGSTLFSAIANNLSEKLVKLVPLIPMVAALWWAFRGSVELPADAVRWLLFAVSVIAAGVMVFSIDIMIASLAFWLDDVWGVTRAYQLLSMILRGQLVPLALMPAWAEGFIDAQPFRFTLSFPLELVVEDLATREMAIGMALQIGYAVLAVLAARWQWRRGLRAYSAVGA